MERPKQFLDAAFALAGVAGARDVAAEAAVQVLERDLGSPLPACFRELLVNGGWPALLHRHSNSDWPVPIDELRTSASDGLLVFMHENQNVCHWAIPLAGPSDPPVLVAAEDGREQGWCRCADRLSEWVMCQIADHQLVEAARFAGNLEALSEVWLQQLRENFELGTATYRWPGDRNLRFSSPMGRVLLWDTPDQCDWFIAPTSQSAALLDLLPLRHGFDGSLYALDERYQTELSDWLASRRLDP